MFKCSEYVIIFDARGVRVNDSRDGNPSDRLTCQHFKQSLRVIGGVVTLNVTKLGLVLLIRRVARTY